MSNLTNKLLQAMDIIVDQKLANSNRDITVVAQVTSEKKDNGKYDVMYKEQSYYDVPVAGGIYHKGNQVLMLVPQGNFDNDKTILSKIDQNSPYSIFEDKYDYIGSNLITADTKYNDTNEHLVTAVGEITLWDSSNVSNSAIQINVTELTNFVQLYRKFKFSALFETSFAQSDEDENETFYDLDYGIKFIFKNPADLSKPHIYTLSINDVAGYPYALNAEQIKIFEIDKTVPIGELQYIKLYVQNTDGCKEGWYFKIKKPSILGAIDPETEGRTVRISTTETGAIIKEGISEIKLVPVVRRDGEQLTIEQLENFTFTWRIQDKNKLNPSYRTIKTKVVILKSDTPDTLDDINLSLSTDDLWHKNSIITCEVEEPGFTPFVATIEVINTNRDDPWFTLELVQNTSDNLVLRTNKSFSAISDYQYRYTWEATDSNGFVQDINSADGEGKTVQVIVENPGQIESPTIDPTVIANQWTYNCTIEIGQIDAEDKFKVFTILDSQDYIIDGEVDLSDIEVELKTATIYCTTPTITTEDEDDVDIINEAIKNEILDRLPWPRPETPKFDTLSLTNTSITEQVYTIQNLKSISGTFTFKAKWTWVNDSESLGDNYIYESKQQYTDKISADGWSQPRIFKVPDDSKLSVSSANLDLDARGNSSGGVSVFDKYDSNGDGTPDTLVINADLIRTGALEVKKGDNVIFSADLDESDEAQVTIAGWEVTENSIADKNDEIGMSNASLIDENSPTPVFFAGKNRAEDETSNFNKYFYINGLSDKKEYASAWPFQNIKWSLEDYQEQVGPFTIEQTNNNTQTAQVYIKSPLSGRKDISLNYYNKGSEIYTQNGFTLEIKNGFIYMDFWTANGGGLLKDLYVLRISYNGIEQSFYFSPSVTNNEIVPIWNANEINDIGNLPFPGVTTQHSSYQSSYFYLLGADLDTYMGSALNIWKITDSQYKDSTFTLIGYDYNNDVQIKFPSDLNYSQGSIEFDMQLPQILQPLNFTSFGNNSAYCQYSFPSVTSTHELTRATGTSSVPTSLFNMAFQLINKSATMDFLNNQLQYSEQISVKTTFAFKTRTVNQHTVIAADYIFTLYPDDKEYISRYIYINDEQNYTISKILSQLKQKIENVTEDIINNSYLFIDYNSDERLYTVQTRNNNNNLTDFKGVLRLGGQLNNPLGDRDYRYQVDKNGEMYALSAKIGGTAMLQDLSLILLEEANSIKKGSSTSEGIEIYIKLETIGLLGSFFVLYVIGTVADETPIDYSTFQFKSFQLMTQEQWANLN